ncbi:MAG: aminopeptidase P family protein [Thermodesulfobacteriota bacterium]
MGHSQRLQKIQAILKRRKIDAFLVSEPRNRFLLSGYLGQDHGIEESAGHLLIPKKGSPQLLTDFRFKIQAQQECRGCEVQLYSKGLIPLLKQLLPRSGAASLAFESHYTLHSTAIAYEKLASELNLSLVPLTGVVEKQRLTKSDEEIDSLKASVRLNEKVFQAVLPTIQPGETELAIALRIETTMREMGAQQPSFDTIVATGKNSALPHAVPSDTVIEANRPLMIDMGLVLDGYCSDMTRTFVPGEADDDYLKIHRLVRKAQLAAMEAIRPGISAASVDKVARRIISDAGYGEYFGHALGHGVGLAVHEGPSLSSRNRKYLREGMVVTVEPGIYLPDWGGVRLENMVLVTRDGSLNLNHDTSFLDL